MKTIALVFIISVEIGLVRNDFTWEPGKCRIPMTQYNWKVNDLIGVRTAWAQTNGRKEKCIYLNITKTPIKNIFIFEKITRIFNTSQTEWKLKEKGILRVHNSTAYFNGKLDLPFRSMDFHAVSQTWNCICVFVCEQFLLVHRWDATAFYSRGFCGFWWGWRCVRNLRRIGVDLYERITKTKICPGITEDDDHPPAEPDDCKLGTQCGNFITQTGETIANMAHGVYKKILQKIFGNGTAVTTEPTALSTTATAETEEDSTEDTVIKDFR